jgi:branched-subunit amino acid aminotransferase/4-amino-4-deoxychorismate lyase
MQFLIFNGKVTTASEMTYLGWLDKDFMVLPHSVWYGYGGIPLLKENIESLKNQVASIGAELPALFNDQRELFRICKRMLNKNKCFRSGHLHIRVLITEKDVNTVITATACEYFDFPLAEQGVLSNFAGIIKPVGSEHHRQAVHNRTLWMTAENLLKSTPFQQSILLNEKGFVTGAIGTNLFAVKDQVLLTPSHSAGCFDDVLRNTILRMAEGMKLKVIESDELSPEILLNADEIFLVSEERGMQWLLGLENKRYVRVVSVAMHDELNSWLKKKVES